VDRDIAVPGTEDHSDSLRKLPTTLALQGTINDQVAVQQSSPMRQAKATDSPARYEKGIHTYERTGFPALVLQCTEGLIRRQPHAARAIWGTLYKVLGGGSELTTGLSGEIST